jgi:hypothetical protein
MDPIPLAIIILAAVIAVQTWFIYQATRSNERNTDRSIDRMDRSLEHMDHAVERMDQSTAACNRAADACQTMADSVRLLVQREIMRDRPQPGPAE